MKRYLKSCLYYFGLALVVSCVGVFPLYFPIQMDSFFVISAKTSAMIAFILTQSTFYCLLLILAETVYYLFLAKGKLKIAKLIYKSRYVFDFDMKYIKSLLKRNELEEECQEEQELLELGKMMKGMNKNRPRL